MSAYYKNTILRRQVRDLELLHWATRESDVASMIFVAAFLVHIVSWIFSISRIITLADSSLSTVTDVAAFASVASALGAVLAVFHFQRKFFILVNLWCILGGKARTASTTDDRLAIRKIKTVAFTQIVLTLMRLLAACSAAVALPWSVVVTVFPDNTSLDENIPYWIALGSVCTALLSIIMFFVVEYRIRYDLTPRLGEYICEAFRKEIELMYTVLSIPQDDIATKQQQERETWEYVAREFLHKYRFDTVFAADRSGSILQYIQSGMDPRQQ